MRNRPGVIGVQNKQQLKSLMDKEGKTINEESIKTMTEQMELFKSQIETFSKNHRHEIIKNPELRTYFLRMCSHCGIDPLASSKAFWAKFLGIGDYYYELAVHIVQVCFASQKSNGGIMDLKDVLAAVISIRSKHAQQPTISDLLF
ncbi:vacuolar-sorting protein SNF8-like [Zophobas morio]|uniref:vacuolar-sorting protein SNF8-like n=1 Tax=Zophobas morio TaxID=2755281 RepID=UPI0030830E94